MSDHSTESGSNAGFRTLVDLARRGDERALIELTQSYEREIRLAARVLLGPLLRPELDSMDLVQSVHRRLIIDLRRGKVGASGPEQLRGLVMTIMRHRVGQWRRRQLCRQRLDGVARDDGRRSYAAESREAACVAEDDDRASQLMSRLNPAEREVDQLRLRGYSTAEAARELGLDPDVLRVRLCRMRRRLAPAPES
jgi:RNA polymerase sigma factor (sigma-70 family)